MHRSPAVRRLVVSGVFLTALTAGASLARAQTNLTWDANGATAGTGGTATWDTTSAVWFDGTSFVPWTNSTFNNAIFSGTAGTVTLGVPISAQNLTFGTNGYAITGSTLTLGSGSTPTIILAPGISATISSFVAGGRGLTVSGGGTLTLGGSGTTPFYSGTTTVSGGSALVFASPTVASRVTSTSFLVNGASTLVFNSIAREDLSGGTITFDPVGGGTARMRHGRMEALPFSKARPARCRWITASARSARRGWTSASVAT